MHKRFQLAAALRIYRAKSLPASADQEALRLLEIQIAQSSTEASSILLVRTWARTALAILENANVGSNAN